MHLRAAYNSATAGRDAEATHHSQAAVQAAHDAGDERLAGWVGEAHAAYLQAVDPVAAQRALNAAGRANNAVLRPLAGLDYQTIGANSPQSEQAVNYLTARYASGADLVLGFDALLADIDWDDQRIDEAEQAIADLGLHLGFASQRPELIYGIGSDVLWAIGNHTYAVIEAKTGSAVPLVWKKDINQLAGSVNWCVNQYGADATVIPLLVHRSHTIQQTGSPPKDTRVITKRKLKALKRALRDFSRTLARNDQYRLPTIVGQQLHHFLLDAANIFKEFTETARRESN